MKLPLKTKLPSVITGHLDGINRALLDGEKRLAFLEFLNSQLSGRRGIYALYRKNGRLYYVGKASDLSQRLKQHLKDKHSDSWVTMTLFFVDKSANVAELEGLVVATANPPGNKQKPKIGQDLRKTLRRFLRQDAVEQIDQAIFPGRQRKDALSRRITTKKLKALGQARLAKVLGISQGYVSHLLKSGTMRKHILEAGKRDRVLLLLSN
jgi:GIY-YIG catalytic domain